MSKTFISLIFIFFFLTFSLVSASSLDFSYSEKVYANTSLDKVVIWNDYGDVAEIKLELEVAGMNISFSDKLIQKAQIDNLNLDTWGEFTHKFQVPNVTQGKKVDLLLNFKAKYNVTCNAEPEWFYFGDNKIQCGKIKIDFNTLSTEVFTANYSCSGTDMLRSCNISNYQVKPQSYLITQDKNKIIATLNSKYQTEIDPLKSFSSSDLIMLDPTYQISNLSTNAVLSDVECEGGGKYCHLKMNETLVTYLPFDVDDNLTGGTIWDWSRWNNNYLIAKAIHNTTTAVYGGSLQFRAGAGERISVASNLGIGVNNSMTVCFWAKNNAPTGTAAVFNLQPTATAGDQRMTIYLGTALGVNGVAVSMTGEDKGFNKGASVAIATQNWNHYCVVSLNTTSHPILYVNGTNRTTAWTSFLSSFGSTETSWGRGVLDQYNFVGNLDEAMIFNRTLTAGEVSAIFNGTFARFANVGNMSLNWTARVGYNRMNITPLLNNQKNATGYLNNISLYLGNRTAKELTPRYNLTNGSVQVYNTKVENGFTNFSFDFVPDTPLFFSPVILTNLSANAWNIYTSNINLTKSSYGSSTQQGLRPSLALDSNGWVHEVWNNASIPSAMNYCNNTNNIWTCKSLPSFSQNPDEGSPTDILFDSNGGLHVLGYDPGNTYIYYCNNTGGAWSCDAVANVDYSYFSLAIDSENNLYFSHMDPITNDMEIVRKPYLGTGWTTTEISSTDRGDFAEIAVDSQGRLGYINTVSGDILTYANSTINATSWTENKTIYDFGINIVSGGALDFDSNNKVHILATTTEEGVVYCNNTASNNQMTCNNFMTGFYADSPSLTILQDNTVLMSFSDINNQLIWLCNTTNGITCEALFNYRAGTYNDGVPHRWLAVRQGFKFNNVWNNSYHMVFSQVNDTATNYQSAYYFSYPYTAGSGEQDTTPPIVTVIDPTNKNYTSLPLPFNVTTNEATGSCKYSFDNFITNVSMTQLTTISYTATNTTIADGFYTVNFTCNDTSNKFNSTAWATFQVDTTYPLFSNYQDNNGTLTSSGLGKFNVTVDKTNTTVLLNINGANVLASNYQYCNGGVGCNLFTDSATCIAGACTWITNFYNTTYTFSSAGTYAYNWSSWGNGTNRNYNASGYWYYSVLSPSLSNRVSQSLTLRQNIISSLIKIKTFWDRIKFFGWVRNLNIFSKSNSQGITESSSLSKSKTIRIWLSDFFSFSGIVNQLHYGLSNIYQKIGLNFWNGQQLRTERNVQQKIDMSELIYGSSIKDISVSQAISLIDVITTQLQQGSQLYRIYVSEAIALREELRNSKQANLTSAQLIKLNILRGYVYDNPWCYQETANISTSCGGLATGNYSYNGGTDMPYLIDGDWDTRGYCGFGQTLLYSVNYTIPANTLGAIWELKVDVDNTGSSQYYLNKTIPAGCLSSQPLQLSSDLEWTVSRIKLYCYNYGTSSRTLLDTITGTQAPYIYEEAVIWNIQYSVGSQMESDKDTNLQISWANSVYDLKYANITSNLKISLNSAILQIKYMNIEVSQAISLLYSTIELYQQAPAEAQYNYVSEAIALRDDILNSKQANLTSNQVIRLMNWLAHVADSNLSVFQRIKLLELIHEAQFSNKWVSQAIDFSDFISRLEFKQNLQTQRILLTAQALRQQNLDVSVFQLIDFFDILQTGRNLLSIVNEKIGLGLSDNAIAYLRSDVSNAIGWYTLSPEGKETYITISQAFSLGDFVNRLRDVLRNVADGISYGDSVTRLQEGFMRVYQIIRFGNFNYKSTSATLEVIIDHPVNNAVYPTSSLDLNVTILNTTAISSRWYSLDGAANVSFTPNITLFGLGWEAWHTVTVSINDTNKIWAYDSVTFYTGLGGGTGTATEVCKYKKAIYYNELLPFYKPTDCI